MIYLTWVMSKTQTKNKRNTSCKVWQNSWIMCRCHKCKQSGADRLTQHKITYILAPADAYQTDSEGTYISVLKSTYQKCVTHHHGTPMYLPEVGILCYNKICKTNIIYNRCMWEDIRNQHQISNRCIGHRQTKWGHPVRCVTKCLGTPTNLVYGPYRPFHLNLLEKFEV